MRFLKLTCWIVIAICCLTVIGWVADVSVLKTAVPNLPSMKMNTTICIILCCVVLLLSAVDIERHFNVIIPLNLIVLVISLITIFEYVFNINLKIDEFLVKEHAATTSPGRMALTSATCLSLLSVGFAIIVVQAPDRLNNIARLFFYVVTLITALAIIGYILDVPFLHKFSMSKSMALLTAVLLLPLSLVYVQLIPRINKHN